MAARVSAPLSSSATSHRGVPRGVMALSALWIWLWRCRTGTIDNVNQVFNFGPPGFSSFQRSPFLLLNFDF